VKGPMPLPPIIISTIYVVISGLHNHEDRMQYYTVGGHGVCVGFRRKVCVWVAGVKPTLGVASKNLVS
jgi:hypothetical protein